MTLYRKEQHIAVDIVQTLKLDLGERHMNVESVRRQIHAYFADGVVARSYRGDVVEKRSDAHRALTVFNFHLRNHQRLDRRHAQIRDACTVENLC